jgi:hypothetical protein
MNTVNQLLTEVEKEYDNFIKQSLQLNKIPQAQGHYIVPTTSGDMKIHSKDLDFYKKLFKLAPNQSVGPGEIALYWCFQHQKNSIPTVDNRGQDKPDLKIGNKFVEVKAYGSHSGRFTLGRFSSQKDNLTLLNIIFSINTLSEVLQFNQIEKISTPLSWTPKTLVQALKYCYKLKNSTDLLNLSNDFEIVKLISEKIQYVTQVLGGVKTAEQAASKIIAKIIQEKLGKKPGHGNYIASVKPDGDIHFFYINFNLLEETNLLDKVSIDQGQISVNFMSIFN